MAKKNSAQSLLMWMLMALLIAGLGGFGIDGFLSQRVTTIGTVGDRPITAQAYSRALQSEIRAFEQQVRQPVTFAMAQAMGLDARVRSQLIIQAALENEVERIGISVGDEQVSRRIAATPAFQGPTGDFDLATYRFQLQSAGLTVAEFEESMRIDAARGILILRKTSICEGTYVNIADNDQKKGVYSTEDIYSIFNGAAELNFFELETIAPMIARDGKLVRSTLVSNTCIFKGSGENLSALLEKEYGINPKEIVK